MNLIIDLVNGILFQLHRFKPQLWLFDAFLIWAGTIKICKCEKNRTRTAKVLELAFWAYFVILFSGTIFMRRPRKIMHCLVNPLPFFQNVLNGSKYSQIQFLYNILMFIPFGILYPLVSAVKADSENSECGLEKGLLLRREGVLQMAFLCSLLIEVIQLVTRRGFFEIADIINNVLGAGIGWLMVMSVAKRKEK